MIKGKKVLIMLLSIIFFWACDNTVKKEYYDTGELYAKYQAEDSVFDGYFKLYYKDGKLKEESYFKEGKQHGSKKVYFPNGQLDWQGEFKNDMGHGLFKDFTEEGILISEGYFYEGEQDSVSRFYFPDGQIKHEAMYQNGVLHGDFLEFYSDGQLMMSAVAIKGETVYYEKYDDEGVLLDEFRLIEITPRIDTLFEGEDYEAKIQIYGPLPEKIQLKAEVLKYVAKAPLDMPRRPVSKAGTAEFVIEFTKSGHYYLNVQFYLGEVSKTLVGSYSEIIVIPKPDA